MVVARDALHYSSEDILEPFFPIALFLPHILVVATMAQAL